ncbi:2-hydroxy-3-oxopropionate reductase [Azoarcus sp. DD4]|uniref:NAD(P)-dependent oxidoreductase n=1 Tax=Azoarcus sp. DD4 TaxID=2027405 RepID=UPI00112B91F9|nr:NAD(P)-dependent oxidoreductase [Azoarcus sp. DD4]QDF98750.1 2-hydroxy-3-oxopropionate reductase [Azoarcus sp. DD4]
MKVGFVGLGVMGRPMVGHLLAAGHEVAVWARRPAAAQALIADGRFAGVELCTTPAELAARSEVVISMVTASSDVEALAFGADGLAAGFAPGAIHADMSTIAPATARALAARYAAQGVGWLDAPVSGGEIGARDATLAIMAGGEAETLVRVQALFAVLGRTVVHIGPAGAGQVAKACNQMIMVSAIQACAEAMHLANAHGVDLAAVRRALMGGSAASRVMEVMGERMVRRDFQAGIEARLHHKDFAILMNEAVGLGTPLPIAAQVWQQLNALMAQGMGRDDTASLLRVLEGESMRETCGNA